MKKLFSVLWKFAAFVALSLFGVALFTAFIKLCYRAAVLTWNAF